MRMTRAFTIAVAALVLLPVLPAFAAPQAQPVNWTIGETQFSGFLIYDDSNSDPRPGLVLVPNWMGVNAAAVDKAKTIAGDDYVVLLADVYGKDVRPKNADEAGAAAKAAYADRSVLRTRVNKAVEVLKAQAANAPLDATRIGAIGFCFGGSTVLELARSGSDVAGVVSFHGGLGTTLRAAPGAVKASVLVLNGADDRNVPAADIAALQQELDAAGADWQFVNFSGAVHCFAEPDANSPPGCVYNARAAARAFRMMHDFFDERFAVR